jgi:hypothetical protein
MKLELNPDGLCLKRNQLVTVRGGIGHGIVCDSGTMWVTQDGDARDIILRAGESFTLDRNGTALVQAFEPGSISITRPAAQSRASVQAELQRRAVAGVGFHRGVVAL